MTSAAIAGYNAQFYITSTPSVTITNEALTDAGDHQTYNDSTSAHQCWDKSASWTVQTEYDEVQSATITGVPTGGTFTLTFGGHTTTGIAYNAAASVVQSALVALSGVGAGQVTVSGANGGPYTIEFTGTLGYASQSLITASGAGLTGGTSPGVTIARVQSGSGFATITTGFVINYAIGQIVFTSIQDATTNVRVSGKYFPFAFLGFCTALAPSATNSVLDVTSFTNPPSPWKTYIAGENAGTVKITKWWIDGTFLAHMSNGDLLILRIFPGQNSNQRFQGYGVLTADSLKFAVNSAISEELDFNVDGQLFYIPS